MNPLLNDGTPRYRQFGASLLIQLLLVAAIILAPLLLPESLQAVRKYRVTMIETKPTAWKPQPQPKMRHYITAPDVPVIHHKILTTLIPPVPKTVVRRRVEVAVPVLAGPGITLPPLGSIPILKKPRAEVAMGSFGSVDGLPATKVTQQPNVNASGFPDANMHGDGGLSTGTSKKGISAVTGFGDGNGAGNGNGNSNRREVVASGFGDQTRPTPVVKPITAPVASITPPIIHDHPKATYTPEALAKHIEGEVVLAVTFSRFGQIEIQKIIQSLPEGLSDKAIDAAKKITFDPATQNGVPVDFSAYVHVKFELAE